MLISANQLESIWRVKPGNVLHVGAHEAEELDAYVEFNWGKIVWVEVQPDKVLQLKEKIRDTNHIVIEAAVWDKSGVDLEMKVMSNSASSSLLDLGTHKTEHPDIKLLRTFKVKTKTLEDAIPQDFLPELIALDIQGAELRALQGFGRRLTGVKWIYTEVNRKELYEGCCLVGDLDEYLKQYKFKRMATRWTVHGWGDALYVHESAALPNLLGKFQWTILTVINYLYTKIGNLIKR